MARLKLVSYAPAMIVQRPSGFIQPCLLSKAVQPPSGPLSLMVRRDAARVRCFTRGGHDWADRFPRDR